MTVLYLGAVAAYKGVPELLSAMQLVLNDPELAHVDLALAGAGDRVGEVEALAAGHPDRVRYLGVIRGEAKHQALNEADVVIVPSTCLDNFPRVILDGFSHGLPVIGSDRGGIPEVIHAGEDGLIATPEPVALARAMGELARDPERRHALGAAARRRAESLTLAAFEQRQLSRIYPEAVDVGYAMVSTSTPGGVFYAYASVVDNKTADPTFIAVQ